MPEQWFTAYADRNAILAKLKYPSYKAYLESGIWASIRQKVIKSDRGTCRACGARATCVHHREYTQGNLSGKDTDGLVSLCHSCHSKIEFAENLKLSLSQANAILEGLIAKYVQRLANARDIDAERKSRQDVTKSLDKSPRVGIELLNLETRSSTYCPICGNNPTCNHPKQYVGGHPPEPPRQKSKHRKKKSNWAQWVDGLSKNRTGKR